MAIASNRPIDELLPRLRRLVDELAEQRLIDYVALDPIELTSDQTEQLWIDPECDLRARYQSVHCRDSHGHQQRALLRRVELILPRDFRAVLEDQIASLNRLATVIPSPPPPPKTPEQPKAPKRIDLLNGVRGAILGDNGDEHEGVLETLRRIFRGARPFPPRDAASRAEKQSGQALSLPSSFPLADFVASASRPRIGEPTVELQREDGALERPPRPPVEVGHRFADTLRQLGFNSVSNRNVINALYRTYPLERLAADELAFVEQGLTLEWFLLERERQSAIACELWTTNHFRALGHTGPAAIRRARAFERALVDNGLIDELGQLRLDRLTEPLVEAWAEIHNWYVLKIGALDRLAYLPGEINPFTELPSLVVPGLDDRLRQLPYRMLYSWVALGLQIRDIELGKSDQTLAELVTLDRTAIEAGLTAYSAVALAIHSPSYDLAVASLYKLIVARKIGSHYSSRRLAEAVVKAACFRYSVEYRKEGPSSYNLLNRSTKLIIKNDELWQRALRHGGIAQEGTG